MSEECTHDCSSCSANCSQKKTSLIENLNELSRVGKVIAVVSGKGGTGQQCRRPSLGVPSQAGPRQDTRYIHFPWRPRSPVQALDKYWISLQQLRERYILKLQICFMNKQSLGTDFLNGASQVAQW